MPALGVSIEKTDGSRCVKLSENKKAPVKANDSLSSFWFTRFTEKNSIPARVTEVNRMMDSVKLMLQSVLQV